MTTYLFVYHGGKHPEPEQVEAILQQWQEWMDSLGDDMVDGGAPVGMSSTVMPDGQVVANGGSNPAHGYSLVRARDQAHAQEMAKTCPHLEAEGHIEIAPLIEL